MSIFILSLYALTGVIAGFLAGLFGVGGGIIIVPTLLFIFLLQGFEPAVSMHIAIGTSLATIILTSISSACAHNKHGAVQWRVVRQMATGLLLGGILGALFVKELQSGTLQIIFAVFEIIIAIKLLRTAGMRANNRLLVRKAFPHKIFLNVTAVFISAVSAVVGIGGGSLSVPFLRWLGLSIQKSIATSAVLGLPIAISGSLSFVWIGAAHPLLPAYSLGFVYLPALLGVGLMSIIFAPFGAQLAHKLPEKLLQRGFAVGLLVVAVLLLY